MNPWSLLFFCCFLKRFIYFVYEYFAGMDVYAPHVCSAHRSQKRAADPLEEMVEVPQVGDGTESRSSARTSTHNHWSISPAPA